MYLYVELLPCHGLSQQLAVLLTKPVEKLSGNATFLKEALGTIAHSFRDRHERIKIVDQFCTVESIKWQEEYGNHGDGYLNYEKTF